MSLATNVESLATRTATECKSLRTLINGNQPTLGALTTIAKGNLVAAINEVNANISSGGAHTLDDLNDVVITTPATGHVIRHNGTNFVNVLGTTFYEVAGAAAAAQSASQPLDSDLTSIAALTTTAYGRAFLALANQAALAALLPVASETLVGEIEIATQAETNTGTDDARAVTPLKLQTRLVAYAQPLNSGLTSISALATTVYGRNLLTLADQTALYALLPTDTDPTLAANSDAKIATQKAVKAYADALIGANDAMVYRGIIDASTNPNYPAGNKGDTWRISVAGKVGGAVGPNVEVGDMITCLADGSAAGTQAAVGANWNIIQANLDGAVVGPASAVSGNLATYSGTSGKIIADSGVSVDTDAAMAANSNTRVPSQAAVKAYAQPLDADLTAIAALTTQAFGRSLLTQVDAAAVRTLISTYSQSEIGDPTTNFVATFNAGLV